MEKGRDVIIKTIGNIGVMKLNRPHTLNALNLGMVTNMIRAMREWESKKSIVVLKGSGGKALSSGADVKWLVLSTRHGSREGFDFFRTEYNLIAYISSYKIPYVVLADGIIMGAGVGLTVRGKYRIATEKTTFAMPESNIGLFSDSGATHFLTRMKGKLGMYLCLTGDRLHGADVVQTNIATHFCEKSKLLDLENDIVRCNGEEELKKAFKRYCTDKSKLPPFSLTPLLPKIDHCFSAPTVEDIIKRLKQDDSEWAKRVLKGFAHFCPTSVKVTFKLASQAPELDLRKCLQIEYRLASACLRGYDFAEGSRALILEKDKKPKWKPPTYEEVTEEFILKRFQRLPEEEDLNFDLAN